MIDNRDSSVSGLSSENIAALCNRRFGIGADGLILLENSAESDFRMIYYNSDGRESSMCGNGGRCIAAFAYHLGVSGDSCAFDAIDGMHEAKLLKTGNPSCLVSLKMKDVEQVTRDNSSYIIDTGSPHYVSFCNDTATVNLIQDARKIRYNDKFRMAGINVNYIAEHNGSFKIRTYERGVEDETWSCGTGTVAAAIAVVLAAKHQSGTPVKFTAPGGNLEVSLEKHDNRFENIWLTGEATHVYDGTVSL